MKICYEVNPAVGNTKSGVGYYAYNIIKYVLKTRHNFDIQLLLYDFLKRNKSESKLKELFPNEDYKQVNSIPYGIYVEMWNYLRFFNINTLFNVDADIFHFFNFVTPPHTKGKVITTVHDMVYRLYPETMTKANYRRLDMHLKRSCGRADMIITVSENAKKEIVEYLQIDEQKIKVVPNGVDTDVYHTRYSIDEINNVKKRYQLPPKYFLYLGTLEPRKNIPSIVEAYHMNKNKFADIKLVIAGKKGWAYDEIFKLVNKLQLEKDVYFPGYIADADMPLLYCGGVAFVFPSIYEGFGLPPLEAMACGIPVITSNASSLPEVVGDAGLMAAPFDIEGLSQSMTKILEDKEWKDRCVHKGLERTKMFSWEKSARMIVDVYGELE